MTVAEPQLQQASVGVSRYRAIIIEDDSILANRLIRQLARVGVEGVHFASTQAALSALERSERKDHLQTVFVLDLMFEQNKPDEGLAFLRDLSRLDGRSGGEGIVLVVTGAGDEAVKRDALSLGARVFHVKPVDHDKLVSEIRYYLGLDVLVDSQLLRIVEISQDKHEIVVRYNESDGSEWDATLPADMAPPGACIEGGSFWLDIYHAYVNHRLRQTVSSRQVDLERESALLSRLLGS